MNLIGLAVGAFAITILLSLLALYRLRTILNPKRPRSQRRSREDVAKSTHLLIVLGSGGHTAEMIAMLERAATSTDKKEHLDWQDFTHRTWVVSSGDAISAERARQFEHKLGSEDGSFDIQIVPRAREIHQPLYTAPISSLRCMWTCVGVLNGREDFTDLILCNGPATATIMIFTSILLRFFDVRGCERRGKMRTIYVESWARVKKLSLSGTLLSRVVDRFLVQWPQLEEKAGARAEFVGVLV